MFPGLYLSSSQGHSLQVPPSLQSLVVFPNYVAVCPFAYIAEQCFHTYSFQELKYQVADHNNYITQLVGFQSSLCNLCQLLVFSLSTIAKSGFLSGTCKNFIRYLMTKRIKQHVSNTSIQLYELRLRFLISRSETYSSLFENCIVVSRNHALSFTVQLISV